MRCSWFRDHMRQVHMDFHMPEFPPSAIKNFNAKEFVDHLERGHVNFVALFSKCHFGNSFYNTKVGHKHSGLPNDFLMEAAAECRGRGIRTAAYYSLCWEKHAWVENPAWRVKDADGNDIPMTRQWGNLCMNTPYKDEMVLPQLEEIASDYPVDGFWLDIPEAGGGRQICQCPYCKQKCREDFGVELSLNLPKEVLQRARMRTVVRYLKDVREMLDRVNPEMVVFMNAAGTPRYSKEIKDLVEVGCWESQPHPGDYLGHSFAARTSRNDIVDIQVMTVRFYQGWGDLTLKPAAQQTNEFAAMIGNGAIATSGDQVNVDGTLQPPVYDMFKKSFGFVKEREEALRDAESVRHAVVLLPAPAADLPMDYAVQDTGTDWAPWRGAHKMLVESHIQTDLVYSILADDLSRYPMIVLPEPSGYQPGMEERLRQYVEQGGILVAAGKSLIANGAFALADVFGIDYMEPLCFSVAHFVPAPEVKGETDDIPLQVRGRTYKVRLNGARELAALYYPMSEYQPPEKGFRSPYSPASETRSPFPFATVNEYGKGKAVYVAGSIFEIYWETNHHWLRKFMEALLRKVDPSIPYDIDASGMIEANLMTKGNDLLLNLIHYAFGHQGGHNAIACVERIEPVHNIPCRVRCESVAGVALEPSGEKLPFTCESAVCSFTVPEIEHLAIVRLVCGG